MKINRTLLGWLIVIQLCCVNAQSHPAKIEVTRITDRIFKIFLNDVDLAYVNLIAYLSDEGILLIDTGLEESASEVQKVLNELGGGPIRYIINTHSDGDHILGNPLLGKEAVIIAHENCREEMKRDERYPDEWLPEIIMNDELTLHFGDEAIQLIAMPCHTSGDIIVHFQKSNILCVGDIIFSDSFPTIHPEKNGNLDNLIQTFENLQSGFPPETRIIVGHGRDITVAEIAEYEIMTSETITAVREAMQKEMSIEQMKTTDILQAWRSWESSLFQELDCNLWIQNVYDFYIQKYERYQDKFTGLHCPYLDQQPPGSTPVVFAPGIVNTIDQNHSGIALSPDGNQMYWSAFSTISGVRRERIWYTEIRDGSWIQPRVAPFSGEYRDGSPQFSPDGKRLYFTSLRPTSSQDKATDANIWFIEKAGSGWSQPHPLDSPVNTEYQEWFPSVANNGNLYYMFRRTSDTSWNIYRSKFVNGEYTHPEKLEDGVNSPYVDGFHFIDPEERYLIFYSERPGGFCEEGELYISYRKIDGTWTDAKNIGKKINSGMSRFPGVSPDGNFFFFSNHRNGMEDIYWVDSKIIDELKPDKLK